MPVSQGTRPWGYLTAAWPLVAMMTGMSATAIAQDGTSVLVSGNLATDDDVALIEIFVAAGDTLHVRSLSYGGGVGPAGETVEPGGFDVGLALYGAGGELYSYSSTSESWCAVDDGTADPVTGLRSDACLIAAAPETEGASFILAIVQAPNAPAPSPETGTPSRLSRGFIYAGQPNFTDTLGNGGCPAGKFCDQGAIGEAADRRSDWSVEVSGAQRAVPVRASSPDFQLVAPTRQSIGRVPRFQWEPLEHPRLASYLLQIFELDCIYLPTEGERCTPVSVAFSRAGIDTHETIIDLETEGLAEAALYEWRIVALDSDGRELAVSNSRQFDFGTDTDFITLVTAVVFSETAAVTRGFATTQIEFDYGIDESNDVESNDALTAMVRTPSGPRQARIQASVATCGTNFPGEIEEFCMHLTSTFRVTLRIDVEGFQTAEKSRDFNGYRELQNALLDSNMLSFGNIRLEPVLPPAVPHLTLGSGPAGQRLAVGDSHTFRFSLRNDGTAPAQGTELSVAVPVALEVTEADGEGCEARGSVVTCRVGTVAEGAEAVFAVTVQAQSAGEFAVGVVAGAANVDEDVRDDVVVTIAEPPEPPPPPPPRPTSNAGRWLVPLLLDLLD